jgi:hypothetical protein
VRNNELIQAELGRATAACSTAYNGLTPFAVGGRIATHMVGLMNNLRARIEKDSPAAKILETAELLKLYAVALDAVLIFHDETGDRAAVDVRVALEKLSDAASRIEDEYRPKAA